MKPLLIVEGKNDRARLRRLVNDDVRIVCTYGTLSQNKLDELERLADEEPVFIFTDNDDPGRRIRAILREVFPDAYQLYTRKDYAGVEHTPDEHLVHQLRKVELDEYLTAEALAAEAAGDE